MKKISAVLIMGFFLLIHTLKVQAQANSDWQLKVIEPHRVAVSFSKTTNIIFPYAIVSVDIGSPDVLAQKAKGVENILQIKAAKDDFLQTNMSIITADGKLTSFLVDYAKQPSVLNLSITDAVGNTNLILSKTANQRRLIQFAEAASISKEKLRGVKDWSFGICLRLNGVFINYDVMLLRFSIVNETNINYEIDQFRVYIRDLKKSKRTATQELEITPLLVHNNIKEITGQSDTTIVFAVPKFTIPDKKYLSVQLMEKNGGRHLELRVKNKKIVKAVTID